MHTVTPEETPVALTEEKTEKKAKKLSVPFLLALLLPLLLFAALFSMLHVSWKGWVFLSLLYGALFLLHTLQKMRKLFFLTLWLLVFVLSFVTLNLFREDKSLSCRGDIVRESIRAGMHLPIMDGNTFFEIGASLNGKGFDWSAPLGYSLTTYDVNGVPLELLSNKKTTSDKLIVHLHGGGYILPLSKNYRDMSVDFSKISGEKASVATIDYRVSPNTYPCALEDAFACWLWLIDNGYLAENIILVGDSAGGNLVLALTAKLRDEGYDLPQAVICISPRTDYTLSGDSFTYNLYNDPMFGLLKNDPPEEMQNRFQPVYPGSTDPTDPYLSPLFGSFEGFPDMLLLVGTQEVLESDSINVYQKATAQGVQAKLIRYQGMFHSFQFFGQLIPESEAAWNDMGRFLQQEFQK